MTKPVVCIGESLVDLIAPAGSDLVTADHLVIRDGGAPANVAVALSRLGVPARMLTVVGDDPFGARLMQRLSTEGVDTTGVRVAKDTPTTIALAWSDDRGDGHFRIHRHADRLLSPSDIHLDNAEAIVIGSVAMCATPSDTAIHTAIEQATRRSIPIVFDVNVRPGLIGMDRLRQVVNDAVSASTVLKLSVDDARHLWRCESVHEVADYVARFELPNVVITDGKRGAMLCAGAERYFLPIFQVDAVEPTGAGDAFTAALTSRMIARGWQRADESDLSYAMAAGALATTHPGAMDGLPTRMEIEEFLRARIG